MTVPQSSIGKAAASFTPSERPLSTPFPARETRRPRRVRPAELDNNPRTTRLDLEPAIGIVIAGLLSAGVWIIIGLVLWNL